MFVENLKETLHLGKKLSQKFNPQSIVLLQGPIGAGKTSFVQGIAKGLSISEDITSPTFALSHHYNSGKIPLIHLDLYRLENISSAKEVFFAEAEEAVENDAILVIEWPELIEPLIESFWKIEISYAKKSGRNYKIKDPKNFLTFS
ncbi:tRNA (adenosine(37)-N6)-threonylcarbamoyltransferase complex ATPase subunit type 1 TsaE [Prochlorococcus marinus]|uniref:tRNA (adenosine(37)-N6)-threonylcarbamoyltransferase complex ATPase subunit type 1 TsaE n=1 Tax=Prochlorococcus marinus TaxID=1219 RepID=UPI001ADB2C24|nr:tRNA (adenosine(37)-N6)-threonylcarbamoyltransferase complex ATPase subunit type 1 TsaE [Prochlorococcus marinus CUG1415]MBW3044616.1 tRNA (adenosine(37)-N6)-threonylcarbamoyltransferase complex ATPase subunit type 1 TsaE [Prochlorococcus marinus str. MU1415]